MLWWMTMLQPSSLPTWTRICGPGTRRAVPVSLTPAALTVPAVMREPVSVRVATSTSAHSVDLMTVADLVSYTGMHNTYHFSLPVFCWKISSCCQYSLLTILEPHSTSYKMIGSYLQPSWPLLMESTSLSMRTRSYQRLAATTRCQICVSLVVRWMFVVPAAQLLRLLLTWLTMLVIVSLPVLRMCLILTITQLLFEMKYIHTD